MILIPTPAVPELSLTTLQISDWFFSHHIQKFIEAFYVEILGASDYWFRLEWQHRGSPHVHGLVWLQDAPNVEQVLSMPDVSRCSASYRLHTVHGQQKCRFGYLKHLQPATIVVIEDGEPEILTARNDGLVNNYNSVQLSAWRANVDIKFIVSRKKVIE